MPTDTPPGGERKGVAYVPQRESWDCGVASLAMAAGVSYEDALAVVPESQRGDLLHTVHFTQWLGALGCAVRKTYAEHDDLRGIRLLCRHGHFVVVRPDGLVNDPARGEGLPLVNYENPFDVWEVHRLALLSRPAVPSEAMRTVYAIVRWQSNPILHELTCGNDSRHHPLVPFLSESHEVSLKCLDCGYSQAHIPDVVLAALRAGGADA